MVGKVLSTAGNTRRQATLLVFGLMFFWQLLRHAPMSLVMSPPGWDASAQIDSWTLAYYALSALAALASAYLTRRTPAPACVQRNTAAVACGLAGATAVAGLALPNVGIGIRVALVASYSVAAGSLAQLAARSCFLAAIRDERLLLTCVFASAFGSILMSFAFFDLLAAGIAIPIVAPVASAGCLIAFLGNEDLAVATDGPTATTGRRFHPRFVLLMGLLAVSVFAKVVCDAGHSTTSGMETARLMKHIIGFAELAALLALAFCAKSVDSFTTAALYSILGGLIGGLALVAGQYSDELAVTGVATVTSVRVCSECSVLAIGALSAAREHASVSDVALALMLPTMLVSALGYGLVPLEALGDAYGSLMAWTSRACVAIMAITTLASFGASWFMETHLNLDDDAPNGPSPTSRGQMNAASPAALRAQGDPTDKEASATPDSPLDVALETLARTYGITPRELDVARYICLGYSAKGICEAECLSVNTVQAHTRGIYRKLDIHSRKELIELVRAERAKKPDDGYGR